MYPRLRRGRRPFCDCRAPGRAPRIPLSIGVFDNQARVCSKEASRQRKKKRPTGLPSAPKKPISDQIAGSRIASSPTRGSDRIGTVDLSQTHRDDRQWSNDYDGFKKLSHRRQGVIRLYERAVGWDRVTRQKGKTGGIIGFMPLRVLETLIFEAADYRSGRLESSFEGIAYQVNISVSS